MSKYGIIVNADDCVGCHACFVACKEENQVAPGVKWNHLERLEHPAEEVIEYFRVSCMHCENPACMKVCPVKAVYFGPHGEVLIDQKKCIGCKGCLAACPYGAPKFSDPNKQSYTETSNRSEEEAPARQLGQRVSPEKPSTALCARIVLPKDACLPALKSARLRLCS